MKKSERRLRLQSPEFVGTSNLPTNPGLPYGVTSSTTGLESLSDCVWKRNSGGWKSSLVTDYLVRTTESSMTSQIPQNSYYRNEYRGDFAPEWKNFDQRSFNTTMDRKSTQASYSRKTSENTNNFSCLKLLHCFTGNNDSSQALRAQEKLNTLEENPFPISLDNDNNDSDGDHPDHDDDEIFFSCEGDRLVSPLKNSKNSDAIKTPNPTESCSVDSQHMVAAMQEKEDRNPAELNSLAPVNDRAHQNQPERETHPAQPQSITAEETVTATMESHRCNSPIPHSDSIQDFQMVEQKQELEQPFANPEVDLAASYCKKSENKITEIPLGEKLESEFLVISDSDNDENILAEADMDLSDNEQTGNKSFELIQTNVEQGHNEHSHSSAEDRKENPSKEEDSYDIL